MRSLNSSQPVILRFRNSEPSPRPRRAGRLRLVADTHDVTAPAALTPLRDRLLRMIVENERDRSHGNRAS
jgi:hypothetical protein